MTEHCAHCHRHVFRRGLCNTHYRRSLGQAPGDPTGPIATPARRDGCAVDGCESPHRSRGWCHRHYQQWLTGRAPGVERERECATCEDAEFIIGDGHPYETARRLGYSANSKGTRDLRKHLRSHGRADLADRLYVDRLAS